MAPELLQSGSQLTDKSDIYALAIVMIEVWSGRDPFHGTNPEAVMMKVVDEGKRPERPTHADLSDAIWETIQGCWCQEPAKRLKLEDVIRSLTPVADYKQSQVEKTKNGCCLIQ